MIHKLQLFTSISLALALSLASGCKGSSSDDTTTDASTSDGSTGSSGPGATSQNPTTSADSGMATDSASGDTSPPTTGPVCENAGANGEACADGCDCETNECFAVGALGGVCSDCDSDEDCADSTGFGCNFGNPLTGVPAVCSATGDLGEGCETTDACAAGTFCTTLIDVPGVISAATCSECESDADCTGGQLCTPTYDIETIAGHYRCVDPGTIPDDEGCDLGGSGNMQCESGNCSPAAVMGIPVLGVCSPCNEDMDCPGMGTCQFPELAIEGTMLVLVPGECI